MLQVALSECHRGSGGNSQTPVDSHGVSPDLTVFSLGSFLILLKETSGEPGQSPFTLGSVHPTRFPRRHAEPEVPKVLTKEDFVH